jgi:hypothetical protein
MENLYNNPVVTKVRNGTVRGDADICRSCRYSLRTVGAHTQRMVVICNAVNPSRTLREPVAVCSSFLDRTVPTLDEMNQIAWQLQTDKGGRKIGFLSPEQLSERRRDSPPHIGF